MNIWSYDGERTTVERGCVTGCFSDYLRDQGYETTAFGTWGHRDSASARAWRRAHGDGPEVIVELRQGQAIWVVTCAGLGEWLNFTTTWLFPWLDGNNTHMDWSRQAKSNCATILSFEKKA